MDRFRGLPKSLLDSISQRGQTQSPQTLSPQEAPQKSSTSEKNAAARKEALKAGLAGAAVSLAIDSLDTQMSPAMKAARAISMGASSAAMRGTYTASEGSVLARAAKAYGAGLVTHMTLGNSLRALGGAVESSKFGVGQVARPYV
jgi:hypothetical protein